jgi:hypothetical protein
MRWTTGYPPHFVGLANGWLAKTPHSFVVHLRAPFRRTNFQRSPFHMNAPTDAIQQQLAVDWMQACDSPPNFSQKKTRAGY